MKTVIHLFTAALISLFCANSATAVELDVPTGDVREHTVAIHGVRYLEDAEQRITAVDALHRLRSAHDVRTVDQFDAGSSDSRFWLYFPLRNVSDQNTQWRIIASTVFRPLLRISLYSNDRPPDRLLNADDRQPYADRDTDFRMLASRVFSLEPGQSADILIEYEPGGASRLPLYVDSVDGFTANTHLDDVTSAIFYCFSLTMIAVFLLFGAAARHRVAMMYAALFLIGLVYTAANEGFAFEWFWPQAPAWNARSPLVLMFVMNAWGFLLAYGAMREIAMKPRVLKFLFLLALLCAVLTVVLPPNQLVKLYYIGMTTLALMFFAQAYAMTAWARISRHRYRIAMIAAVAVALLATSLILMVFQPALLPELIYMNTNRLVYLVAMLATMATITSYINGLHRDNEQSLKNELESSRREAETSRALFEAEQNYVRAKELAVLHQRQLATASHDMRQPLFSLRATLDAIAGDQSAETRTQLRNAFDYLENICTRSLDSARAAHEAEAGKFEVADESGPEPDERPEPYALNLIMDTTVRMFEQEARGRGLELHRRATRATTDAPPLVVMRIISNFVSNAIKHTRSGRILLGARRHSNAVRIEVHDTGPGMDDAQLAILQQAWAKGSDASGEGLGLAICRQLADQYNLHMLIRSKPGRGTCCSIELPVA